jgi:hypothetical protein
VVILFIYEWSGSGSDGMGGGGRQNKGKRSSSLADRTQTDSTVIPLGLKALRRERLGRSLHTCPKARSVKYVKQSKDSVICLLDPGFIYQCFGCHTMMSPSLKIVVESRQ